MYETLESYRAAWERAYTEDPPIPLNLDIELASTCNAKCTFCLYGDQDWRKSMQDMDWDGKPKKRFMPTEMALKLIHEASELGIPAIKFNFRGESVIHPEYGDIVEYAASQRITTREVTVKTLTQFEKFQELGVLSVAEESQADVLSASRPIFHDLLANTNGNIPDALLDSSIRGLMACTKIMVSLDSMDPEIYPKVRVGLSLDSAKRTIDELVKLGHPNLWVRRVICKDNKDEPFAESVYRRWPNGVKVSEHYAFDRNHYQNEAVHGEDHTKWERQFCGYTAQRCVIESSGRYSPCCIAWDGELSGGMKYPETSIIDYWNSSWRKKLTSELRENIFTNDKCKNCTSFMSFKRPERYFVQDIEVKR